MVDHLTIAYVLEGARRGYSVVTPTDGIDPEVLKGIWRGAMPRGKMWSDAVYLGARSLKVFTLPDGRAALSESVVTGMRDEAGRAGIRQTEIALMSPQAALTRLRERLNALPFALVREAETRLASREWGLLFRKYREAERPMTYFKPQTILAYPYTRDGWAFVEACLLLLVTRETPLTNLIEVTPRVNPFADPLLAFTTLALDFRDESRLVALPLSVAQSLGAPFIDLSSA